MTTMLSEEVVPASSARPTARLSSGAALAVLASIIVSFIAGSIAPTPLYGVYQAAWGFSPITTTVIFGVYALAVLGSLLTFGSLSDHVGRRPVLLVTLGLQAITMLLFATAGGVAALLVARVIQGLATGAAIGALGAGMLDLDRAKGTIANSVAPMIGTAVGGLFSGLLVRYLPAPTHLVYLVFLGIYAVQAAFVLRMAETSSAAPGALASLRPRLHLPPSARGAVLLAGPLLVAGWALIGFHASLGPALLRTLVVSRSPLLGGLPIAVLASTGALTVLFLRARTERTLNVLGAAFLVSGVALLVLALAARSPALFFAGTAIAGAGFGAGFQGALRTIVPRAAPHERAGLVAVVFVISYLAMGLPAVVAGIRVVHGGGIARTGLEYTAIVLVLAVLALGGALLRRRSPAS